MDPHVLRPLALRQPQYRYLNSRYRRGINILDRVLKLQNIVGMYAGCKPNNRIMTLPRHATALRVDTPLRGNFGSTMAIDSLLLQL